MIFDTIDRLSRYKIPQLEEILKFINNYDCANLIDGETEIKGRQLFVRIMSYEPKPAAENRFETHRNYMDVQYVISGAELMQTARPEDLKALTEYDEKGDYQFFQADGPVSGQVVKAGEFAVFYPLEPHRPSCRYEGHRGAVKKLIFKVRMN
ncbi:MAG: YhcH/YjgK/YiaL family protein [Candidatus Omnitrophica bacterium]|nr:YhcH/YjgK/YiaL family protein [Candidatus Omnitrophota bacterium]